MVDFKVLYDEFMAKAESGGNPYKLSHADRLHKTSKSGYSFGKAQLDISSNLDGANTFSDIINNAKNNNSISNDLFNKIAANRYNSGYYSNNPFLNSPEEKVVSDLLSSNYGQSRINIIGNQKYQADMSYLQKIINSVPNNANRAFLNSNTGKLLLTNYHNQLHISENGLMHNFLKTGQNAYYTKQGDTIGITDFINYHLKATKEPSSRIFKRFNDLVGVLDSHGELNFTVEDAAEFLELNKKYGEQINKYGNLKNLANKAKQLLKKAMADNSSNIIKQATQNFYNHPDVNYDPTQRVYNPNGQVLKQASTQGNQPPAASKPFGRQPVYQSANNAAINATVGSLGVGVAAASATGHYLYQEAAKGAIKRSLEVYGNIVKGVPAGGASPISGAVANNAWTSVAKSATSSAWSAFSKTAIGSAISSAWTTLAQTAIGQAISGVISSITSSAFATAIAPWLGPIGVVAGIVMFIGSIFRWW